MSSNSQKSICAFDIGIKNLSYCILNKDKDTNTIVNWELIDLRTSHPQCIGQLKGGKICGKPAKLCHKTNQTIFYCAKHAKQYKPDVCDVTLCKKSKPCEYDVTNNSKCNKNSSNIFETKVYCNAHLKKIQLSQSKENKLCNLKITGCMKEPLYDLGMHMYEALDKRPEILEVEKIVIENQPSLTNPTMKSISVLLLSYFIMKKHQKVEFISPSGKLKVNDILTKSILSKCTKKNKYKITKELGVKYSEKLLECFTDTTKWNLLVSNSKKKDDLCDAFLHAYYHLFGSGGLTSKDFVDKTTEYFETKINTTKKKSVEETIKLDV